MPAVSSRVRGFFTLLAAFQLLGMRAFVFRSQVSTKLVSRCTRHRWIPQGSTARFSTASAPSSSSGSGSTGAKSEPESPRPSMDEAQKTFNKVFPVNTAGADLRPVVLFDGVCMFCNRGIDTLLALDVNRKIRVAPLQSELGRALMTVCGRDPDDLSSMLVVEADKSLFSKSDAAIRIAEVAAPHPLLGGALERSARLLLPQEMRDGAYDTVAENRYSILGKREECRLPDPGDDRFIA